MEHIVYSHFWDPPLNIDFLIRMTTYGKNCYIIDFISHLVKQNDQFTGSYYQPTP